MTKNEKLVDISSLGLSDKELFAHVDNSSIEAEKITAPRYSYWKSVARVFFKKKINIISLFLLLLIVVFAYVYPAITHFDPLATPEHLNTMEYHMLSGKKALKEIGFSLEWIVGTGASGESMWNSIWYGSSISISLAAICGAINMIVGIIVGAIWGFSKKVDIIMNEVFNVIGNIPYLLIVSVMVMMFSASFWTMVLALTVTGWLGIAYFIRTQVIIIRDREYNLASRCLGTPIFRLTFKNILPFMTSVIVTLLAAEIPGYISYEVFLSYIGLGLSDMSLGKIIGKYENNMFVKGFGYSFWYPVIISSIVTIVLYLVGQNLGDASDPRTHM